MLKHQTALILCGFLLLLSIGAYFLHTFTFKAGEFRVLSNWPSEERSLLTSEKPHFVMFLHPKCSCSLASLEELKSLLPLFSATVQVVLVIQSYTSLTDGSSSALGEEVKKMNVKVVFDENSRLSKRLGVNTSGTSFLVEPNLDIVFQGGLTPYRGHQGSTEGKVFLQKWISQRTRSSFVAKVFGCGLWGSP